MEKIMVEDKLDLEKIRLSYPYVWDIYQDKLINWLNDDVDNPYAQSPDHPELSGRKVPRYTLLRKTKEITQ